MSPDSRLISLIRNPEEGEWELAFADPDGRVLSRHPLLVEEIKKAFFPVKLCWSPEGDQLALLLASKAEIFTQNITGYAVFLAVFDRAKGETRKLDQVFVESSDERLSQGLQWFPDNRRILLWGSRGSRIVNTVSGKSRLLNEKAFVAHLTGDGESVFFITAREPGTLPTEAWRYELGKEGSQKISSLNIYPAMSALSRDGRYLVLQQFPVKEPGIFVLNLKEKELKTVDTRGLYLTPKVFAPNQNTLLACASGNKKWGWGILDIATGEFRAFKESDVSPSKGLLVHFVFDWIDWKGR